MIGRAVKWGFFVAALAVVAWLGVATWSFSNEVRDELLDPLPETSRPVATVSTVGEATVTLEASVPASWPGTWMVEWRGGYGRIGGILEVDNQGVERSIEVVEGELSPGTEVFIDLMAYRGNPQLAHGIAFEEASVAGPLGSYPAWHVSGGEATWIVIVHGRSAEGRREALRILPALAEAGYSALIITYRNDLGAPPSDDGLTSWGFEEWRDVEAAVLFARASGADNVVLFGMGAGGAAAAMFMRESRDARHVLGMVLDSAVLDLSALEDRRYHKPGLDGLVADWGRALAAFRFSVEWSQLDQVSNADRFKHPMLVLHGSADETVPIEVAAAFAAARPDLVTYAVFEGGRHGALWNHDPSRYESVVLDFVAGLIPEEEPA